MALRDDLLPIVEDLRGIGGELGFRLFEVHVRVRKFSGPRPGISGSADSETTTQVFVNGENPKVREVSSRDRVAGSEAKLSGEWEIGPLTPEYVVDSVIAPTNDGRSAIVHYILKGPGLPPTGLVCQKISDQRDRPLRIMIRVRSTGQEVK
jgi:hypothetical protein